MIGSILRFSLLALMIFSSPAEASFVGWCRAAFNRVFYPEIHRVEIAQQVMPKFILDHQSEWRSDPSFGGSRERIVEQLKKAEFSEAQLAKGRVKNETYIVTLSDGLKAVVKTRNARADAVNDSVGSGRLHMTRVVARPEYEALASLIDDLLQLNIVPPATMRSSDRSIQAWSDGSSIWLREVGNYSQLFVDYSHMKLIDFAFTNFDRPMIGNLKRNGNRLVVFDFDLSRPALPSIEGAREALWLSHIDIGGSRVQLPAVLPRRTINQIKNLTPEKVYELARKEGIPVDKSKLEVIVNNLKLFVETHEKFQADLRVSLVIE